MSGSVSAFYAGCAVGLAVAAPIGPMGVLCIQRTLVTGWGAGLATGLGAAIVLTSWGAAILLGLGAFVAAWLDAGSQIFAFASALVLSCFAVRIFRRSVVLDAGRSGTQPDLRALFAGALVLALVNPLTLVLVAAAIPALSAPESIAKAPQMLLGIFCGSIAWWIALSATVAVLRSRINCRFIGWINITTGLSLLSLAVITAVNAVGLDPQHLSIGTE